MVVDNIELIGTIENCVFGGIYLDVINGATISYTNKGIIRMCLLQDIIMICPIDKSTLNSNYNSGGLVGMNEGGELVNIHINGMVVLNGNNKGLLMIKFKKSTDGKLNKISCIKIDDRNNIYNLLLLNDIEYNNIDDIESINNIFYINNYNYILINTLQVNTTDNNILNINNDNYNSCQFYTLK
jgi:hypothetical protein